MKSKILQHLNNLVEIEESQDILTLTTPQDSLLEVMKILKDNPELLFKQLSDICGVDYFSYGETEWKTKRASSTGYSRGIKPSSHGRIKFGDNIDENDMVNRFCIVYHLLSIKYNFRLRIKVFIKNEPLVIPSVVDIWASADWYEREAFDLFGILFEGHPDLRRILTDYGFIGYPFRKDFPLIGNTQVRYDPELKRVVYEPVDIEPRVLVPKVIRDK